MLNIVSEQALEIIPKLTQQQINIISNIQYILHMSLQNLPEYALLLENSNKIINDLTSDIGEFAHSHLNYMASLGSCYL